MKRNTKNSDWKIAAAVSIATAIVVLAAPGETLAQPSPNPAPKAKQANLTVEMRGLRSDHGKVVLALFNSRAGFPEKVRVALRRASVGVKGGRARIVLRDVPPGTYAVAVFHDENGNGKLDTTWTGRPKEGVGMSNDARGHRGPPKFEDASFKLHGGGKKIQITIRY